MHTKIWNPLTYFFFFFLAVLGLRLCVRAFSSCGKWGPLLITVRGPLTVAASLVAEHRLQTRRLSSRGSRAQPLRGMRDPPRPGLEPASPAPAGRLPTTAPPGKPPADILFKGCQVVYYIDMIPFISSISLSGAFRFNLSFHHYKSCCDNFLYKNS